MGALTEQRWWMWSAEMEALSNTDEYKAGRWEHWLSNTENLKRGGGSTDWATLKNWSGEMGALTEQHWWFEAGRLEHWLSNTDDLKRGGWSTDWATLMNMTRGGGNAKNIYMLFCCCCCCWWWWWWWWWWTFGF